MGSNECAGKRRRSVLIYKLYRKEDIDAYDLVFEAFDTLNSITLYGASDAPVQLAHVLEMCLHFQKLWNFSDPNSDIAHINAAGTKPVRVSPITVRLLEQSLHLGQCVPSFSIAMGSVTYLWKRALRIPTAAQLSEALSHANADMLHCADDFVWKDDPLLKVDIGGSAKGFIADEICRKLRAEGVLHAKLDLGGSLAFVGSHPEGRSWRVRLGVSGGRLIEVNDCAVSSSGNNQRSREVEGRAFGHVIDPRTAMPAEARHRLVSVVSRSALLSDVLSTACLVADEGEIARLRARFACDVPAIHFA